MTQTKTLLFTALGLAITAPAFADGHMEGDSHKMDHPAKIDHSNMDHSKMDHKRMKMESSFETYDTNLDGQIDFTEYYNYESQRGVSDVDAATAFSRMSGTQGYIDSTHFSQMKRDEGKMDKLDRRVMSRTSTPAVTGPSGGPSLSASGNLTLNYDYGSFMDYDANQDGRVNFTEYSTYRNKSGIKTTAAAQEFMRLSDGQNEFDESRFSLARDTDAVNNRVYRTEYRQENYTDTTRRSLIHESERMLEDGMDGNLLPDHLEPTIRN